MEFGNVQRGILGVEGGRLNSISSKEYGLSLTQGFYINKVTRNSGADKAGSQRRCYCKIDEQNISSFADLSGYINTKRQTIKYK
jgi:S1-C subfamily serine protease